MSKYSARQKIGARPTVQYDKLDSLVRETERRLDGHFPKIVTCNAFGFEALHERAHRGNGGICKSVDARSPVAHCVQEGPQRVDRFGRREASRPVKDMKHTAGRSR